MIRSMWVLALGLASCATAPHAPAKPLRDVQKTSYFAGEDGLHVQAIDFADGAALVDVEGLASELTGKVLAYQRVENGDRLEYRTKWHGRDLYALVKERDGRWVAYIPGAQNGHDLTYVEDESAKVDATTIQRTHQAQEASGELRKLQSFDRPGTEKDALTELNESAKRTGDKCGKPLSFSVNWPSVSETQLLQWSVSGYCSSILSGLDRLCDTEAGKQFVSSSVTTIECTLDGDNTLRVDAGKLRWMINFELVNADQRAYAELLKLNSGERTLAQRILNEQTTVCADSAQKHVVLIGPREAPHHGLAYGDGQTFSYVRSPEALGDGWFFEPRQRNEKNNDNFRGLDLRVFSHVEPSSCELTCGAREVSLQPISGAAKDTLLTNAKYVESPMQREPYALARDKAGTYYYVDHGVTDATARDFKLYRGPRGKLKPLAMKDVVSDSEGEIFASTSGKLRLVLGKQSAQWIAGGTSALTLLPLGENYTLIYNELGVYLGAQLGVPCDDL
ncbi:MAG TPA: hypothetical protein VFX59_30090 [Polyangiales bacterium]|nr:hypothetical protein [Polyangiales bacterium]